MSMFLKNKSCLEWRKKLNFTSVDNNDPNLVEEIIQKNLIKFEILQDLLKKSENRNSVEVLTQIKNIESSLSINDKLMLFYIQKNKNELKSNLLFFISEVIVFIFIF